MGRRSKAGDRLASCESAIPNLDEEMNAIMDKIVDAQEKAYPLN